MKKIYNRTCSVQLVDKDNPEKIVEITINIKANHANGVILDSLLDSYGNLTCCLKQYKEKQPN